MFGRSKFIESFANGSKNNFCLGYAGAVAGAHPNCAGEKSRPSSPGDVSTAAPIFPVPAGLGNIGTDFLLLPVDVDVLAF